MNESDRLQREGNYRTPSAAAPTQSKTKATSFICHGRQVSLPVDVRLWRINPDCIKVDESSVGKVEKMNDGRICEVCALFALRSE